MHVYTIIFIYIYIYIYTCIYLNICTFRYVYVFFSYFHINTYCFSFSLAQFSSSSRGMFPGGESWKQTLPAPQIIRGRTELWTISSSQCLASKILGFHPAYLRCCGKDNGRFHHEPAGQRNCYIMFFWLVVWNNFYFSIYWEESSQLTFIFFRGVETTNQLCFFSMFFPLII